MMASYGCAMPTSQLLDRPCDLLMPDLSISWHNEAVWVIKLSFDLRLPYSDRNVIVDLYPPYTRSA
jgi:hypothetical protein